MAGVLLGYCALNWNGMEFLGHNLRMNVVGSCLVTMLIVMVVALFGTYVDNVLQIGGFFIGFLLAALQPTILNKRLQKIAVLLFLLLAVALIVGLAVYMQLEVRNNYSSD